jgi:hypothetical protein
MPVSTTADMAVVYGGDSQHFLHVLDYLFVPAIEKAGYEPIKPVMSGADVIQAEIVRNLETADLVLCDITAHNPNVFFELGIRTSLDRPVALVRDSVTERLPFDTGIMNTHTYDAGLYPWRLSSEIEALADHIVKSAERSKGSNPLWKYFGLTQRAEPQSDGPGDPVLDKLDLLLAEVHASRARERGSIQQDERRLKVPPVGGLPRLKDYLPTPGVEGTIPVILSTDEAVDLALELAKIAAEVRARMQVVDVGPGEWVIDARPFRFDTVKDRMEERARRDGIQLQFIPLASQETNENS